LAAVTGTETVLEVGAVNVPELGVPVAVAVLSIVANEGCVAIRKDVASTGVNIHFRATALMIEF
jgi:repressor of nif and glnA expression